MEMTLMLIRFCRFTRSEALDLTWPEAREWLDAGIRVEEKLQK